MTKYSSIQRGGEQISEFPLDSPSQSQSPISGLWDKIKSVFAPKQQPSDDLLSEDKSVNDESILDEATLDEATLDEATLDEDASLNKESIFDEDTLDTDSENDVYFKDVNELSTISPSLDDTSLDYAPLNNDLSNDYSPFDDDNLSNYPLDSSQDFSDVDGVTLESDDGDDLYLNDSEV